jgi:hypothetical protein
MKAAFFIATFFLFAVSAEVLGPDGKPLPGFPGGPPLMREQMTPVDTQHVFLVSVANAIEAQQRRTPDRSGGALEGSNPQVSWEQGNDPNSFVYQRQGPLRPFVGHPNSHLVKG